MTGDQLQWDQEDWMDREDWLGQEDWMNQEEWMDQEDRMDQEDWMEQEDWMDNEDWMDQGDNEVTRKDTKEDQREGEDPDNKSREEEETTNKTSNAGPPALQGLFLLSPARCLIIRPYADSSELSYSYCMVPPPHPILQSPS